MKFPPAVNMDAHECPPTTSCSRTSSSARGPRAAVRRAPPAGVSRGSHLHRRGHDGEGDRAAAQAGRAGPPSTADGPRRVRQRRRELRARKTPRPSRQIAQEEAGSAPSTATTSFPARPRRTAASSSRSIATRSRPSRAADDARALSPRARALRARPFQGREGRDRRHREGGARVRHGDEHPHATSFWSLD